MIESTRSFLEDRGLIQWCRSLFLVYVFLIVLFYLFFSTGLHSDEYTEILRFKKMDAPTFFSLDPKVKGIYIFGLPAFYILWWVYAIAGDGYQLIYDTLKYLCHVASILFVYKFFTDYMEQRKALLAASFFILFPIHDTTTYWYLTVPYVLTPALIMYAHHWIKRDRYILCVLFMFLGSFFHYSSPPYVFGLALILGVERSYKKALIFSAPGFAYVLYYLVIGRMYPFAERRIHEGITVSQYVKNYLLQIGSSIDALIGPSAWLKIYYSIESIGVLSLVLCLSVLVIVWFTMRSSKVTNVNWPLFAGLVSVLLFSYAMFSLTGWYTQTAFNLGNRVTVYGSLLLAYLLVLPVFNKRMFLLQALVFFLPVFGLSDYWKSWNDHQMSVMQNIKSNQELALLEDGDILLITGNIFSRLGPFSHIELFIMPWTVNSIFHEITPSRHVMAITSNVYIKEDRLIDPQFGRSVLVKKLMYLYDSERNVVSVITPIELEGIMEKRPREIWHWVQLLDKQSRIRRFISTIVK
tara:strand:- start:2433 stop:4001 length:1569 start_codon:yes stop_codon:yes gene_type:complete